MVQKKYFFVYFFILQIGFVKLIMFFPQFIEQFYSNLIYVYSSNFLRILFGKIPFSVGDVFYTVVLFFIFKFLWKFKKNWNLNWKNCLLQILNFLSISYFLFHLLWGFNYYREPLFEKMNIKKEYTDADLISFTQNLIVKTNKLHLKITKNKNVKVLNLNSQKQLFQLTQNGFDNLAKKHSFFKYQKRSVKNSVFSLPLSYMGFSGYLNPFTNEAQVNYMVPKYGLPMTICHEMAHQIGYASESECNFIGFLAASKNDDLYFKYAAYTTTLKYCFRSLSIINEKIVTQEIKKLNKGIRLNFNEDELFWKNYESFIETGFKVFYDNFLKLNQQNDGLESYSKYLNLLINYNKTNSVF